MDINQQKEQFSLAYLHVVATAAGFKLSDPRVDDESVDVMVGQSGGEGTMRSPRLEVQLKCTERDVLREDGVHFQLKRKNYDDLRDPDVMVPRILVVMLVPEDTSEWLNDVPEEEMCLRRYAWWMPLVGEGERLGVESPTVILPRQNLFNPDTLSVIMGKVGNKEPL
jgi:hypothetical protein